MYSTMDFSSSMVSGDPTPGNPFVEPPFGLLLAHGAFTLGALDAHFGFLDDVKVILDVFEVAVIGQFIQEALYFVLGRIHRAYR